MKKGYYIFISQFFAALTSKKPFFIAKKTKASNAIASVFIELNIIRSISIPNKYMLRNMQKIYEQKYLAYWINYTFHKNKNKIITSNPATGKGVENIRMYNTIELIGKKSNYHKNKMSYKELLTLKPHHNTIYIMQTSKGLITSKEALCHKVGGFVICKINLLLRSIYNS